MEMPQGAGSGVVWDKEGHLVTNFHVIKQASEVQVGQIFSPIFIAILRAQKVFFMKFCEFTLLLPIFGVCEWSNVFEKNSDCFEGDIELRGAEHCKSSRHRC